MKKLFTLFAVVLTAITVNATVVASYSQGVQTGTFTAVSTGDSTGVKMAYSTKYNANTTPCTAITFTKSFSVTSSVPTDYYVKVESATGSFLAGDTIICQPFTQMGTGDYTGAKYANLRIYAGNDEHVSMIFATTATTDDKTPVTDGHEQAGEVKADTIVLSDACDYLYFGRQGNSRLNVISFVVLRAQGGDDPQPVTNPCFVACATNANPALATNSSAENCHEGVWEHFSLATADETAYIRNMNPSSAYHITVDGTAYAPINLNKGANGVYTITVAEDVVSLTLYAKATDENTGRGVIKDFGLDSQTTLSSDLPIRTAEAAVFDITGAQNIRVNNGVYVVFKVEYTTSGPGTGLVEGTKGLSGLNGSKVFRNGQLLILRDGVTYDLTGRIVE